MLYGRNEQLAVIGRLLDRMRSGRAGALVLRGEAGIGKTTLLDAAEKKAPRCYGRGVPEDAVRANVVSLNTWGVQVTGSRLPARYAMIGAALEAGDVRVACFQEVSTWWHLRLLAGRMRSFRQVSFQASAAGPAGGLVTFSRLAVAGTAYRASAFS
jgi:AAA ATPase domain